MNVFPVIEQTANRALDLLIGWLLILPRTGAVVLFAAGTAFLMVMVRAAVTNQDLLARCVVDLRCLKPRIRAARREHDIAQRTRLQRTTGMIKAMQLTADLRVLAVVIIPVALLAVWAGARFGYFPPRVDHELLLRAYFPISGIDRLTHLVPSPEFEIDSSAIQVIRRNPGQPNEGIAEWTLRPRRAIDDAELMIRHQGESVAHHVAIGGAVYLPPRSDWNTDRIRATEVVLEPYEPLGSGVVSRWTGLPPWMILYVMLTIALVPILKRSLRVA